MAQRTLSIVALALAGLITFPAQSQQSVTQVYNGVVTRTSGAHSDAFRVGEPITISYTVNPADVDIDPSPTAGVFRSGLQSLSIALPESKFQVVTGLGTVQTFDNDPQPSDQVFFYSFDITQASNIQGLPVIGAEIDFIDREVDASGVPIMITSDAVPTLPLVTQDSFVIVATSQGWTSINFVAVADAEPTVVEIVEDGTVRIREIVSAGGLRAGIGNALIAKLRDAQAAFDAGDTSGACEAVTSLRNQIRSMTRNGQISEPAAAELAAMAEALRQALGGC